MAQTAFRCRLITPEAVVIDDKAVSAVVPLWDGQMGFLPNRAALVGQLGAGELKIDFADTPERKGGTREFFIDDGFVQMLDNQLTILATLAVDAEKLTEQQAQAEVDAAARQSTEGLSGPAAERVQKQRRRAEAKLRTVRAFRSHSSN